MAAGHRDDAPFCFVAEGKLPFDKVVLYDAAEQSSLPLLLDLTTQRCMSRDLVEIYRAENLPQAQQLVAFLDAEGITAVVGNDALQGGGGELPLGWTSSPTVSVAADDERRGRAFAAEFDRLIREGGAAEFAEPAGDRRPWYEWPVCPACQARRLTACPICGEAGDDFDRTEYDERGAEVTPSRPAELGPAASSLPLLECPMCEERFQPEFYCRCARCGHVFGDGIDLNGPSPREPVRFTWAGAVLFAIVAVMVIATLLLVARVNHLLPWSVR